VAVWRHVYVGESQAQAEDDLAATLDHTRRHMLGARTAHNPADYRVDPAVLNPFNDPRVSDDEAVRYSLGTGRSAARRRASPSKSRSSAGPASTTCCAG